MPIPTPTESPLKALWESPLKALLTNAVSEQDFSGWVAGVAQRWGWTASGSGSAFFTGNRAVIQDLLAGAELVEMAENTPPNVFTRFRIIGSNVFGNSTDTTWTFNKITGAVTMSGSGVPPPNYPTNPSLDNSQVIITQNSFNGFSAHRDYTDGTHHEVELSEPYGLDEAIYHAYALMDSLGQGDQPNFSQIAERKYVNGALQTGLVSAGSSPYFGFLNSEAVEHDAGCFWFDVQREGIDLFGPVDQIYAIKRFRPLSGSLFRNKQSRMLVRGGNITIPGRAVVQGAITVPVPGPMFSCASLPGLPGRVYEIRPGAGVFESETHVPIIQQSFHAIRISATSECV